MTNFLS